MGVQVYVRLQYFRGNNQHFFEIVFTFIEYIMYFFSCFTPLLSDVKVTVPTTFFIFMRTSSSTYLPSSFFIKAKSIRRRINYFYFFIIYLPKANTGWCCKNIIKLMAPERDPLWCHCKCYQKHDFKVSTSNWKCVKPETNWNASRKRREFFQDKIFIDLGKNNLKRLEPP